MAKCLGIIAEYNPFHNGHLYHIQNSKAKTNSDYVIAVMTGNFTQRGNTSIVNKWDKARMAINGGVDLVIELPTIYSISSAENFAEGAIKILNRIGLVDNISFGMEENDLVKLNKISKILASEPVKYKKLLKFGLDKGLSYSVSVQSAIKEYFNDYAYEKVLKGSNNILAIEYMKSLRRTKSRIIPIGIKREKIYYNSHKIIDEYASASGIRQLLMNKKYKEISKVMPSYSYEILKKDIDEGTYVRDIQSLSTAIFYKLRTMTLDDIKNLPEVTEGLENSIFAEAKKTNDIIKFVNSVKSKRYNQSRIQRILLYALLGITKKDMEMSKKTIPYVRVLGFSKNGKKLLSDMNWKATTITSLKRFEESNTNKKFQRMLEIDKKATDIYTLGYESNSKSGLDYTKGIVIL